MSIVSARLREVEHVLVKPSPGSMRLLVEQTDGETFEASQLSDGVMYVLGLAVQDEEEPHLSSRGSESLPMVSDRSSQRRETFPMVSDRSSQRRETFPMVSDRSSRRRETSVAVSLRSSQRRETFAVVSPRAAPHGLHPCEAM